MNHQSFHPDNWNDTWLQHRQPSSTATQRPPSFFHDELNNPQHDYEKCLSLLPYDICGDVLEGWIKIIEPAVNYSGTEIPTWWPEAITFMRPRVMLKREKVKLLSSLLSGKLLEVATAQQLNVSAQMIWRLRSSVLHSGTLAKIINVFKNQQIKSSRHLIEISGSDGAVNIALLPFQDRETDSLSPSKATLIRQIIIVNPDFPGFMMDLSCDFFMEWQTYSSQGQSLHACVTRVALCGGTLIPRDGRLPVLLQNPISSQNIQADARLGVLKLVVAAEQLPGQSAFVPLYLAFSIRVAISIPGELPVSVVSRGWENIPRIIAELGQEYLKAE